MGPRGGPTFINNLRIAGNYEGVSKEHLILRLQGFVFVEPCMFKRLCAFFAPTIAGPCILVELQRQPLDTLYPLAAHSGSLLYQGYKGKT